jgi:hypothetical protein
MSVDVAWECVGGVTASVCKLCNQLQIPTDVAVVDCIRAEDVPNIKNLRDEGISVAAVEDDERMRQALVFQIVMPVLR